VSSRSWAPSARRAGSSAAPRLAPTATWAGGSGCRSGLAASGSAGRAGRRAAEGPGERAAEPLDRLVAGRPGRVRHRHAVGELPRGALEQHPPTHRHRRLARGRESSRLKWYGELKASSAMSSSRRWVPPTGPSVPSSTASSSSRRRSRPCLRHAVSVPGRRLGGPTVLAHWPFTHMLVTVGLVTPSARAASMGREDHRKRGTGDRGRRTPDR
jgi:hypothetical protein